MALSLPSALQLLSEQIKQPTGVAGGLGNVD